MQQPKTRQKVVVCMCGAYRCGVGGRCGAGHGKWGVVGWGGLERPCVVEGWCMWGPMAITQVIGGRQKQLVVLAMHAPHHAVHVCAPQPNKPSWPALAGPTWAGFWVKFWGGPACTPPVCLSLIFLIYSAQKKIRSV